MFKPLLYYLNKHTHFKHNNFHQISNKDITKSLESEFSGATLKCMLAIVGVVRDPPSYYAHQLHKSMKGAGTDEGSLTRIVVTRSEVNFSYFTPNINVQSFKYLTVNLTFDASDL